MPIPPGRYTRQQIRDLALNRAGNRALNTDAIAWLAQILFDLYTLWDWPFLCVTTTVQIAGPTFALPSDFYAPQDDAALKPLTWDGDTVGGSSPILEVDRMTFDLRDDANAFGRPVLWTADRAADVARVTPNPVGHVLAAQLRYRRIVAEPDALDEPADVPVFPWHTYLVQAVYCVALEHEKDPRLAEAVSLREQQFERIRRGASPRHAKASGIPLDPAVFRVPFRGD